MRMTKKRATRTSAICVPVLLIWLAVAAHAADIAGQWHLSYTDDEGQNHESTLSLQADGDKLSGKIASPRGSVRIAEGTIDGTDISFTLVLKGHGDVVTVSYKGYVEGDTMKLMMHVGRREPPLQVTAKREP